MFFYSCSLTDEHVFEFPHAGIIADRNGNEIIIDAKLKLTLSEEDNCVYYQYTCNAKRGEVCSDDFYSCFYPDEFRFKIIDDEDNEIYNYRFNPTKVTDPYKRFKYPIIFKGIIGTAKLNKIGTGYNYDDGKPVDIETFRSKLKRMKRGLLHIAYLEKSYHGAEKKLGVINTYR